MPSRIKHHKSKNRREKDPDRYSNEIVLDAPELNWNNTEITMEPMTTDYLYGLAGPGSRDTPHRDDTPVVIVRFRGNDYLIDGGSRCRKWHNEDNQDMHNAYIITVRE